MNHLQTVAFVMAGLGLLLAQDQNPVEAGDQRKAPNATTAAPQNEEDANAWMLAKLSGSQNILAHLTRGDIDAVATDARRMQVMTYLEQWLTASEIEETSEYRGQLNAFEFSTKELIRHAEDDDVNGALDAYVDMTRTCVKCHQLIRDAPGANE
ncbi:MAG: hypothetical protein JNG89_04990 [Planctomycetaceae bacterium]|nr:hypothetical protein [Planctomycetaceae bacterium]